MKKPRNPSAGHSMILTAHGLKPYLYEVISDEGSVIVARHRITGEVKALEKEGPKAKSN